MHASAANNVYVRRRAAFAGNRSLAELFEGSCKIRALLEAHCSHCHWVHTLHAYTISRARALNVLRERYDGDMVRLLAATRLLLERRNFLLATLSRARAATTSSQLQLRPGEATSDDEKTIYFVRHAEGYHNKGERELPNWKTDQLGLDPKYRDARLTPAGIAQSEALNKDLRTRSVPPPELMS